MSVIREYPFFFTHLSSVAFDVSCGISHVKLRGHVFALGSPLDRCVTTSLQFFGVGQVSVENTDSRGDLARACA